MTVSVDRYPNGIYHNGMATLLFCAILLGAATTLVFTLARSSIAEQRIISNIHSHEHMRQAGDAGLAFAIAWLRVNAPAWQPVAAGLQTTTIPLPGDKLGQVPKLAISINGLRQDSATAYILLDVQAWYPDSDLLHDANRYRIHQYVHISIIDNSVYRARIIPLAGTWHDFGDS